MSEAQQRYRVIERLAAGGMAEVYIAESEGIEGFRKQVAIKRVLPHLTEKKRFIAMFLDEARLSANLSHSNVAQVFDIGVGGDNAYFIVMEYVDGSDLKVLIESLKQLDKKFSVEAAVYIAAKICEGLSYAHELTNADGVPLRIVHRDMSPPNVLITKYGEIKIVDFGLAKATSQLEKSEAGIIKGKFSYLSPEAALGEDVDHRTDIFAVGIILWEMLAGRRLFFGESDFQTVKLVQQAKVPPLSVENPEVSKELDRILQKALARDPNRRYASARELGLELTGFLFNQAKPVSSYDIADLVRA
ncbi:MAG TPA: serine/threonine-protein kinase, partial [Polyangiaceae bacterium]|nr:serine/threonine-protein kinase [Polyangiaceae bacterium]